MHELAQYFAQGPGHERMVAMATDGKILKFLIFDLFVKKNNTIYL